VPKDRSERDRGTTCLVGVCESSHPGLVQSLAQRGVRTSVGSGRAGGSTRLVIHGPEVSRAHSARLGALRRGIRQQTPLDWLKSAMSGRRGVVVLGKHDATTAAAMIGLILENAGEDPCVLLNAPARQLGGWSRHGAGACFVTTWDHPPEALAGVDPEIFVLLDSKRELSPEMLARASITAPGAVLIADDSRRKTTHEFLARKVEWLSLEEGGDWSAPDACSESRRFPFRVFHRGRYVIETRLADLRRWRALSALAAIAVCDRLGLSSSEIRAGLEEFSGVERDFQRRGSFRGVSLIDDRAETVEEMAETLSLTRAEVGARRLWVVVAESCLTGARDDPGRLADVLAMPDRVLVWRGRFEETIAELDRGLEPGDVLLTLGPGEVGTIADAFIPRLPRDRQGR
jgi:UDP-N-acetylmuramate--alanine ligase